MAIGICSSSAKCNVNTITAGLIGIGDGVFPLFTGEGVSAFSAFQEVIALAANERVTLAKTYQPVVLVITGQYIFIL